MGRWKPGARERLMQASLELFLERGFDQTTVAEIAKRAGVTERTFFRYFGDKREVLFAGAELQDLLVQTVADADPSLSPLDVVSLAVCAAGDVLQQRRPFARQRQQIVTSHPELQERELIKMAHFAEAMARALRERGVAEPTASLTAETGIAVFRVAFTQWVEIPGDADLAEHMRRAFEELRSLAAS